MSAKQLAGLLAAAVPLAVITLTVALLASGRYPLPAPAQTMAMTLGILGILGCIAAGGLWLWACHLQDERRRAADAVTFLGAANRQLKTENHHLRNQSELLAAMREMALVTNDTSLFRDMLAKILDIMASLLGSRQIVLYLLDEKADDLLPRVSYHEGLCEFDADVPAELHGNDIVHNAFNDKRSYAIVENGMLHTCTPLVADHESIGVVLVTIDLPADPHDRAEFIDRHQYRLEAIGKHISLPIQKSYLFDEATVDALTKLYTKRHFLAQLGKAFDVARRQGLPMSLILCDIDHFKKTNDKHGHQSGDIVLAGVAKVLRTTIRGSDTAYRYGGEEMAVLLLGSHGAKALEVAERIRASVESTVFTGDQGQVIPTTISLGCCEFFPDVQQQDQLVALADKALYHSKEKGRNRATLYLPGEPPQFEYPPLIGLDRRKSSRRNGQPREPAAESRPQPR